VIPWLPEFAFLGTPLVHHDGITETAGAFADWWISQRRALAWITGPIDPDGLAARALHEQLAARGVVHHVHEEYERAALRRRPEPTYLDDVNPKRLKELRRLRRRLQEELEAPVEVVDRAQDPAAYDQFLALEHEGWKGEAGTALSSGEGTAAFFRTMCGEMAARGHLQLLALQAGARTIAMQCNLLEPQTMFSFKVAYAHEFARFSPGTLLEIDAIGVFHDRLGVVDADSCADPDNELINRLWPDRKRLQIVIAARRGAAGWMPRAMLRAERAARRALRFGRDRGAVAT
jgi:CelD/BcsL family acetyltransferase involved in cellulose biosynthesis